MPYLDGLRALAAIYVVLHHMWLQVWPIELGRHPEMQTAQYTQWMYFGNYAVTFFLVISGFCLMLPVIRHGGSRGGWQEFYRRRSIRILPPYYFSMALSIVLIVTLIGRQTGSHWDISVPLTARGLLIHLFLLQNLVQSYNINHVLWSTAVEFQIYLVFPLLVILWNRIGPLASTLATAALGAGLYAACSHLNLAIESPHYIGVFAIGMFAAGLCSLRGDGWSRLRSLPWGMLVAAGSLVVVGLCAHFGTIRPHTEPMDFLVAMVAGGFLIYGYLMPDTLWNRILACKPLSAIGLFSYSLYLVHAPLIQVIWQYAIHPLGLSDADTFLMLICAGIPIIIGASYLFYLTCELPFVPKRADRPNAPRAITSTFVNKL